MIPSEAVLVSMLSGTPFPHEFDRSRIVSWGHQLVSLRIRLPLEVLTRVVKGAGHTGDHAQRIVASLAFLLPPA